MEGKATIKVALDWTPNTIHSGLYCALEGKYYEEHGLDVQLLAPDEGYSTTPARQLEQKKCDLAVVPSESCIAYNETGKMKLQAIYAILQHDASAVASTTLDNLAALGGGTYGSYNAKYEDGIVRAMVTAAGGKGEDMKIEGSTGKLSLFEGVTAGSPDATWIFLPWEGVEAELAGGSPLHTFAPAASGVPYGYSPVIARDADRSPPPDVLKRFVAATAAGYRFAIENPREAAGVLAPHCRPSRSKEFLETSQARIARFYGGGEPDMALGYMSPEKWRLWTLWLKKQGLLRDDLDTNALFRNTFF